MATTGDNGRAASRRQECEEESISMAVSGETRERTGGSADAVHEVLGRLRAVSGLVSACLVEPDSGHVVDTVLGDAGPTGAAGERAVAIVAAGTSDVVQVVRLMAASLGDPDDVEDVIVTLGRHHHIVRAFPDAGIDGLFVTLTLDRGRTNLALARRQMRALDAALGNRG
jgi:hypothetical protein